MGRFNYGFNHCKSPINKKEIWGCIDYKFNDKTLGMHWHPHKGGAALS